MPGVYREDKIVLFPPRVECQKCGWMIRVRWLPAKLVPRGIDGVDVSKCPRCLAKATHLAGGSSDRMAELAETLYFNHPDEPEISTTDRNTGKTVRGDIDNR